jgi:hypothetical protein
VRSPAKWVALDRALGGAREWWAQVEQVCVDLADPDLIDASVAAALTIDLTARLAEQLEDADLDDELDEDEEAVA